MTELVLVLIACAGTPVPSPTPAPEAPKVAQTPTTPADWNGEAIAWTVSDHFAQQQSADFKSTGKSTGLLRVGDPVTGAERRVLLDEQAKIARPIGADRAHWLVTANDTDSHERVVLDYTLRWTPSPAKLADPSAPTTSVDITVVSVEIQSVAGVDRWTFVQSGEYWEKVPAAPAP